MRIEVLIDVKTILGEGPLWDVNQQRLYFIDSFGSNIFRRPANGRDGRARAVPSLTNGFHFLDFKAGEAKLIVDTEVDKPADRINDSKVDKRAASSPARWTRWRRVRTGRSTAWSPTSPCTSPTTT